MIHRRPACYILVGCLTVSFLAAGCKPVSTGRTVGGREQEDQREFARASLTKSPDVSACRTALSQLNGYLGDHPEKRPTPLSSQARERLTKEFGLTDEELTEIEGNTFLSLDASHLESCCLIRDALSTLPLDGLSPLQRATVSFEWAMRQVRWEESGARFLLPPDFVLRRGWGSASERALVFLAVVDQLGLDGALLLVTPASGPIRLWACGVLIDKDMFLFDPRLGLAVPGPKGSGVATLTQAREQASVLGQLTVDPKSPYDVTQEQARRVEMYLASPLSALAPRMQILQDDLLGPGVHLRLWKPVDKVVQRCKEIAGLNTPVALAKPAVLAQRLFLPKEDGGSDTSKIRDQAIRNIVPLAYLPEAIYRLEGQLSERVGGAFGGKFITLHLTHGKPRDQILRGQFDDALQDLTRIHERTQDSLLKMVNDNELGVKLRDWHKNALEAHAQLISAEQAGRRGQGADIENARQRVNQVWKSGEETLMTIIEGSAAEPLRQQSLYLLALCKHEQAERLQTRFELAPPEEKDNLRQQTLAAWTDAKGLWDSVVGDPPRLGLAGSHSYIVSSRLLRARSFAASGDVPTAERTLADHSQLTELEKTAFLYWAAQLKKNKP